MVTVEEDGGSATTDGGTAPPVDAGSGSPRKSHPPTTAPTKTCSGKLDANGNFPVTSPAGTTYWVGLPTGYVKTKAYPVIIVTHGCDDTAENFCSWGPAAYTKSGVQANDKLQYIALSVEDVSGACWQLAASDKVLDALDDAAACFYVDQDHVTMGGYSSGAAVAYKVGLGNAERFSGILIEDGALYDNGAQEAPLLANADWKINIAHIAHISDPVYPEQKVKDDWAVIEAAGFPLKTFIVPGTHDGTSTDWGDTLDPLSAGWAAP